MPSRVARAALTVCIAASIVGCATYEPVEPKDRYPGRIVHKVQVENPDLRKELEKAESEYQASLFLFGLGSVLGGAVGGALVGSSVGNIGGVSVPGEPYRYTIETGDAQKIVVFNKHSGFKVGDCVAVLVGQQTREVSMAYGASCAGDS